MTDEQTMQHFCRVKAQKMWDGFTESEKTACRFGMFPAKKMLEAKEEGHDGRLLAIEIMNCARRDGGMVT